VHYEVYKDINGRDVCVLLLVFSISDLAASLAHSNYQIVKMDNFNSKLAKFVFQNVCVQSKVKAE
jgi:hypothetical protein